MAAYDQEAFGPTGLREYELALMARAGVLLIAEEDREVVGGCQLIRVVDDPGLLWVVGIYIRPPWQGCGRGRSFLEEIIARLPEWDAYGLVLTVHPDNIPALRLYRSLGFELVDSVPEFYGFGEERQLLVLNSRRATTHAPTTHASTNRPATAYPAGTPRAMAHPFRRDVLVREPDEW